MQKNTAADSLPSPCSRLKYTWATTYKISTVDIVRESDRVVVLHDESVPTVNVHNRSTILIARPDQRAMLLFAHYARKSSSPDVVVMVA